MIAAFLLALLITVAQMVTIALLAPFLTDLECLTGNLLAGRSGVLPGWRWRQIRAGWRKRGAIPALSRLSLCSVLLAMTGIPLASTRLLFGFLSEPLACGVLLILASGCLWAQTVNAAPTPMIALRLRAALGRLGHDLMFLVPLLALTGTLITVGLPGAGTLLGLLQQRLLQPAPALMGGLVFMAAAILLILNRRFLSQSWNEDLIAGAQGRHRSLMRYRHDLSVCCWYLLVADLVWPDSLATSNATIGHLALLWCVAAPLKLTLLVCLAAAWRAIRPLPSGRLALVLSGAAILLVLAGRLST
ncbi:hypothetical protein C0V97_06275 [Asaia sp. W19]|uniref:hypothetical protein n=1 Tax=unclassified Asaia TaxID=2685023 RepID=UPI000F8E1231|nr:hypothetical protein [Asaia sp. W19]RUT26332.1 hypothetical protein C0V97_06275 [Asaia sp. W19]